MMTGRMATAVATAIIALLALVTIGGMTATPVHAAVMGIDFGSEFIKVASVKPGTPFHIVVDEQSKRKIPAVVAFDNGERHFGNGAVQLAMRKPKDTYIWAHRLLGKDINSPEVKALKEQGFPWEIIELPDRRSLGFRHSVAKDADESDVVFSVEEIVAMSLQHIMKIAESDAESQVRDCVLTVPPYWSHRERQALMDAADIAGLNVLSLVNENTAAAIQYGIDRKYQANETHTILIYNMGSTSTKVNLASYSAFVRKEGRASSKSNRTVGQFEMKSLGYDSTLGGHAFEMRIVDWVVKAVNAQLLAKTKKADYDIRSNAKAMAKIRSAAEKAKVVLSANQEAQVFLNSLHEDMDFKMLLTREEFYTMCADLLARVTAPIEQVISESGVALSDIDAVVIIGGGVRIPAVQTAIKTFVQKDYLTQSLNGDEAMVMGAVFRAANLSTTFQVRPFGMVDTSPYAVGVKITNNVEAVSNSADSTTTSDADASVAFSKRASLFKRHNRLNKKKTLQFSHTADFVAQVSHEATRSNVLPPGIPLPIDLYSVTGVERLMNSTKYTELLKEQKPLVALSFLLDNSGLSTLTRAEATLEEMVKVLKPKPKVVKVNATATTDENNSTATATATEGEEKKEGTEQTDASTSADASDAATPAAAAAAADAEVSPADDKSADAATAAKDEVEAEPEFIMKKKTHTISLVVSKTGSPGSIDAMNATHKILAKATLEKLRRADDLKKEIAASKNTLEAHIYATRASIHEPEIEGVSTEEQREAVRSALAAAEDWLYEQGDDSAKVFQDKLAELRALSDPIFYRLAELTELPLAINTTQALLTGVYAQITDYAKNRPWVSESQRESLKDLADDLRDYLAEQQEAQSKLTAFEPPALESEQLHERITPLRKLSETLMKIKKPAPKKKPADKKTKGKKTPTKSTDEDNTTTEEATTDIPTSEEEPENSNGNKEQAKGEESAEPTTTETEPEPELETPVKDEL